MPAEAEEPNSSSSNENGRRARGPAPEVGRGRHWGCPGHQAVPLAPRDRREREPLRSRRAGEGESGLPRRNRGSLRRCPDATNWRILKGRTTSASIRVRAMFVGHSPRLFCVSFDHVVDGECVLGRCLVWCRCWSRWQVPSGELTTLHSQR